MNILLFGSIVFEIKSLKYNRNHRYTFDIRFFNLFIFGYNKNLVLPFNFWHCGGTTHIFFKGKIIYQSMFKNNYI